MKHAIAAFCGSAALWMAWSGHYGALMMVFGLSSWLLVAVLSRRDAVRSPLFGPVLWKLPRYCGWLLQEIVQSNLDVVKRVWLPKRYPVTPSMAWVPATQRTDFGLALHANTITKTPGTLAIDIRQDSDTVSHILVHALVADNLASLQHDSEFDRRACEIEALHHV